MLKGILLMSSDNLTRTCTKCKTEYPATLEYFGSQRKGRYGLKSECKECSKIRQRTYRMANPDKVNKYKKSWRAANPEREKEYRIKSYDSERTHEWYLRTIDERLQYSREYYQRRKNDPEYKKTRQEWIRNNRDKARARWHRRQALIKNGGGTYTVEELEQLKAMLGLVCFYCNKRLEKYIVEHLYPITSHGSNTIDNIVLSCASCNNRKHHKMPWVFCGKIQEIDFYLSETGYRWKEHPLYVTP